MQRLWPFVSLLLAGALSSTAHADEPEQFLAASWTGHVSEYIGQGAALQGARRIGTGRAWAHAAVEGVRLNSPIGGPGGSSPNDGSGALARVAVGIEARSNTSIAVGFAGADLGYQYLQYAAPASLESSARDVHSHSPFALVRLGFELGRPRIRLRSELSFSGYVNERVQAASALLLGLVVEI